MTKQNHKFYSLKMHPKAEKNDNICQNNAVKYIGQSNTNLVKT